LAGTSEPAAEVTKPRSNSTAAATATAAAFVATPAAQAENTVFQNFQEEGRQRANSMPTQPLQQPDSKRSSLYTKKDLLGKAAFGFSKLKSKAKEKAKEATKVAYSNLAKEGLVAFRVSASDLQCETKHVVREAGAGLGITIHVAKGKIGTRVIEVDVGGVADKAGLCAGHVICRIGGKDVLNVSYEKVINALKQQTGAGFAIDIVDESILDQALNQAKAVVQDPLKGAPAWWKEEQKQKRLAAARAGGSATEAAPPTAAKEPTKSQSGAPTAGAPAKPPPPTAATPSPPTLKCIHTV